MAEDVLKHAHDRFVAAISKAGLPIRGGGFWDVTSFESEVLTLGVLTQRAK